MLVSCHSSNDDNVWRISPPPEERSRKPKTSSEYINRTWTRKFSPTRGDFIKMDDEVRFYDFI